MENPFNEESAEEDGEPPFSTYRSLNFLSLQVLEGFFNEGLKAEPGVAKAKSMAMAIAGVPFTYIGSIQLAVANRHSGDAEREVRRRLHKKCTTDITCRIRNTELGRGIREPMKNLQIWNTKMYLRTHQWMIRTACRGHWTLGAIF